MRSPLKRILSGRAARRAALRKLTPAQKQEMREAELEDLQMELEHQLVAPLLQAGDAQTLEDYGWHRVAPVKMVFPS